MREGEPPVNAEPAVPSVNAEQAVPPVAHAQPPPRLAGEALQARLDAVICVRLLDRDPGMQVIGNCFTSCGLLMKYVFTPPPKFVVVAAPLLCLQSSCKAVRSSNFLYGTCRALLISYSVCVRPQP